MTVQAAFLELLKNPGGLLLRRWNWKAALFSPIFRSVIFLCANLSAGWKAALGAMSAEFIYRCITAGFYGALTQAFRAAEPPWFAAITVMALLPLASHSLEWFIHWLRDTPNLVTSILASACFTAISTLLNWYAMRRGVLVVGAGGQPLHKDLQKIPGVIAGFLTAGPVALWRCGRAWAEGR